jgi:drug/metabolite transporter (DMT)-like permease
LLLALDVIVFLIEKTASNHANGTGLALALSFLRQPWIWAILVLKVGQLAMWTVILARVNISLAFPLTSLGFPLAMLAAVVVLGERLTWQVWLGGLLITVGCVVMGPQAGHDGGDAPRTDREEQDSPVRAVE